MGLFINMFILGVVISFIIVMMFWIILYIYNNYHLNKLRRKYNAEENPTRKSSEIFGGTKNIYPTDRRVDEPEQYLEPTDEPERRTLLSNDVVDRNGENINKSIFSEFTTSNDTGDTERNQRNKKSLKKLFRRRK